MSFQTLRTSLSVEFIVTDGGDIRAIVDETEDDAFDIIAQGNVFQNGVKRCVEAIEKRLMEQHLKSSIAMIKHLESQIHLIGKASVADTPF